LISRSSSAKFFQLADIGPFEKVFFFGVLPLARFPAPEIQAGPVILLRLNKKVSRPRELPDACLEQVVDAGSRRRAALTPSD